MPGLKKFVNNLIDRKMSGNQSIAAAVAANTDDISALKSVKANMYIVSKATDMTASTTKVGDATLAPGDFVLDTATPKLWFVTAAGTNKYITLT